MKKRFFSSSPRNFKRSFLLLEVIVALTLLLTAIVGSFRVSHILSQKTQKIRDSKDRVLLSEQALCHLFELLYKNEIPWDVIAAYKSFPFSLDDAWSGKFQFDSLHEKKEDDDEEETKNILHREVLIILTKDKPKIERSFIICVKKE